VKVAAVAASDCMKRLGRRRRVDSECRLRSPDFPAVAVDEAGRPLAEKVIGVGSDELRGWAAALDEQRLPVEDCRQLTGWLER
jgi:hypothetical protein